jgi:hypothetical protein
MVFNAKKTETKTVSWKRYEKETSRKHRGHHIGGPGNPDYLRGDAVGEVKHMQRPVTKPEIIRLHRKGVTEIHSLRGFTEPAMKHVQRYDMKVKLFHHGRRVV